MALPTDFTEGQAGHIAAHEAANTEINRVADLVDAGILGGGSALPRLGGVYSNANSGALVRATVTAATLVHASGDDLVDGGEIVIPSDGVWSLSVTWVGVRPQSGRCFVEAVGLPGNPRASLVGGEDRVTLSWVGPVAQNQRVSLRAYCDQAETLDFGLDVSCYRVGI